MAWPAVVAVARAEFRARWRGLVALGLLFGVLGGAVVAVTVVAVRSHTAHQRLLEQVRLDDARTAVQGRRDALVSEISALPGVVDSWTPAWWVGELQGTDGLMYTGMSAGTPHPDILQPVILQGRAPRDDAVDEVMITEPFADEFGFSVGSELRLHLLTGPQVVRFQAGFGTPAGPAVRLRVVGLGRIPISGKDLYQVVGTPAFEERHRASAAGRGAFLRLEQGPAARAAFTASFDDLSRRNPTPPELAELGDLSVRFPAVEEETLVAPTRRVIGTALTVTALSTALVAVVIVGQALGRHQASTAARQLIQTGLGMTRTELLVAHTAPALLGAVLAGAVGAGTGLAAGFVQPVGSLRELEPSPGYLPSPGIALTGGAVLAVLFVGLAAAGAAFAGRPPRMAATGVRPPGALRLGGPAVLAGLRLALGSRRAPGQVTTAGMFGTAVGVAAAVAALVFGASLNRLVESPERYGAQADFVIADLKAKDLARLQNDPRVAALNVIRSGQVRIGGQVVPARMVESRKGFLGTTILSGRLPTAPGEIGVGSRLAADLGVEIGDDMPVDKPGGQPTRLRVVGVVNSNSSDVSERLGTYVTLYGAAFNQFAVTPPYLEGHLQAVPGQAEPLAADVERSLEIYRRSPPAEIVVLDSVASLPRLLFLLIAAGIAAGLLHALGGMRRRSIRDRAVLRTLGFTTTQIRIALSFGAMVFGIPALLIGIPLGIAVGRLAWWEVATASAVAGDVLVPALAVAAVAGGMLTCVLLAATGGRRLDCESPASVLRAE